MADDYFANFLRDKINDHIFGGPSYTKPGTIFFVAMSVLATAAGGGTAAPGFAAVGITNNSTNFPASSGQQKTPSVAINFGNNTGATVTIVGLTMFDDSSPQNQIGQGALTTPITVNNGQPFSVPAGSLVLGWVA